MAGVFYAIDRTGNDTNGRVFTGTSTQSKEFEIQVTTGVGITRKQAGNFCRRLIRYFEEEDTASRLTG